MTAHEAYFEGGPLHNQTRAVSEEQTGKPPILIVCSTPGLAQGASTAPLTHHNYIRGKEPVYTAHGVMHWRYRFVPKEDHND